MRYQIEEREFWIKKKIPQNSKYSKHTLLPVFMKTIYEIYKKKEKWEMKRQLNSKNIVRSPYRHYLWKY